jgi:hypothetical protein
MPTLLERQLAASVAEVQQRKREEIDDWLDAVPVPPKRLKRTRKMSEAIAVVENKPRAIARATDDQGVSVDVVVARVEKVREVQKRIMKLDVHYGKVPGTQKDCLLKPGAEILGLTFQLGPVFRCEDRWDGEHLESVVTCTLNHIPTGNQVTAAVGSCSTREKKYAWRNGGRKCPSCGKEGSLLKSKDKPEWFCWRKKDGCGATFPAKDERITSQKEGRTPNPDLADNYNTVRKMACKRAHVAAILFATCASEIFTQDIEDSDERGDDYYPPDISPHAAPDRDHGTPPGDGGALGEEIARKLNKVKDALARCDNYNKALALRAIIGTRAAQSELMARAQAGKESGDISPVQDQAIGKLWMHCDRQISKLEKELAPGPEQIMTERQPGEDDD